MKWKDIKDIFLGTFEENLEDCKVYVNIQKSGLYQISYRYPAFPCVDMIHWIVSHTNPETIVLRSSSGTKLATSRERNF